MSAYHNPDWAECYDLWVRTIFGNGPAEDMPVFETLLQNTLNKVEPNSSVSIVDLGTGSGRVLVGLQDVMRKHEGTKFEVWGLEPSSAMLERAKRFWEEGIARYKSMGLWDKVRVEDHWVQCGASDFADHIVYQGDGVDLIIFAAGGIGHITSHADIRHFLENVKRVLHPSGKAVISVLVDFIIEDQAAEIKPGKSTTQSHRKPTASLSVTEKGQRPLRIPSMDFPGLVYVKHPTTESISGNIKTESFKLDVEDESGKILRSHELSWDETFFDPKAWDRAVSESGLCITELEKGQVQNWYFLERSK
jgi:SAM-dependent methyltransferase